MFETTDLYTFITVSMVTPTAIPLIVVINNQWRFSSLKKTILAAVALMAFVIAADTVIYLIWGATDAAMLGTSILMPIISWSVFFVFSRFRDGRLMFSLVTGMLLLTLEEVLADLITPRNTLASILVHLAINVSVILVMAFLLRKPYLKMLSTTSTGWVRMSLLPLILFVLTVSLLVVPSSWSDTRPDLFLALLMCASAVLIYGVIYYMLQNMVRQQTTRQGQALLRSQMLSLEQHAEQLIANDRDNRRFRHDMRHFLSLMQSCVAARDWNALEQVLYSMYDDVNELSTTYALRPYSGNLIIDAVLTGAEDRALAAAIECDIHLPLPKLNVDTTELAVVISNALDNALAACMGEAPDEQQGAPPPRQIKVEGKPQAGQFFLYIANTCTKEVTFDPDTGLPMTDQQNHGYGVQSTAAFAKKYDAMLRYNHKDGWFSLSLLI